MRHYVTIVVGLALGLAISAMGQRAQAGEPPQYAFPFNNAGSQLDREHQVQPAGYQEESYVSGDYDASGSCDCQDGSSMSGSYGCEGGSCEYGGCATCYDWWPGDDVLFGGLCGTTCGRLHIGADYLYVRSSFSEAAAYLVREESTTQEEVRQTDVIHELDFRHESSYRIRGGYELGGCGEELRFTFTRFNSYARATTPYSEDIFVPFDVVPLEEGGQIVVNADVDVKTYDLELAKTIPLGGMVACDGGCGCGYGDGCDGACGCGGCAPCCPTWDITWSGGIRFADADWRRTFSALNDEGVTENYAETVMNFEGGGVRMGLEGRRYLGCAGIFSIFLRGDLSLLLGNLDMVTTVVDSRDDPEIVNVQAARTRNIIPVTDFEGGFTAQLSCHSRLSAGYLFSAWHDLGLRDQTCFDEAIVSYDDANILAFDGMFVRLEADF